MPSKVIIVTGASRGIGLAIAKWLIKNEHKVVLVARSQKDLEAIKNEHPSQVEFLAADLCDFKVLQCPRNNVLHTVTCLTSYRQLPR